MVVLLLRRLLGSSFGAAMQTAEIGCMDAMKMSEVVPLLL
jgi:hypothetical protein